MKTQHISHRPRKTRKSARHKHCIRAPSGHRTHQGFGARHRLNAFVQALRDDVFVQSREKRNPRL